MNLEACPVVYLLASRRNGTLYVGVTSDIVGRIHQHRAGLLPSFTRDCGVRRLVCLEPYATVQEAIVREKRIKKWNRAWKLELIEKSNPEWHDLAEGFGFESLD